MWRDKMTNNQRNKYGWKVWAEQEEEEDQEGSENQQLAKVIAEQGKLEQGIQ